MMIDRREAEGFNRFRSEIVECADDGQRRQGQAPRSGDLVANGEGVTIAKV